MRYLIGLMLCASLWGQGNEVIAARRRSSASSACGSFAHCYSLTYDHTQVGTADSSGFPALVSFSDANLKDIGHSGYVNSSAGADILFFSDSGMTTQIASELDFYDNVNGVGCFWVRIATLSHSSNGTVYVAVGNASPPSRTSGVWDANFLTVAHFANGSTLSTLDSTGNNTLTNAGSLAGAGHIDGSIVNTSVNNQYVSLASGEILGSGDRTIAVWIQPASNVALIIWDQGTIGSFGNRFRVFMSINVINVDLYGASANSTAPNVDDGYWHRVVVVSTTGLVSGIQLFIDGSPITLSYGNPTLPLATVLTPAYIASTVDGIVGTHGWIGGIDELQVSNVARGTTSAYAWITAEYNNQNAPGNIGSAAFWTWAVIL